MGIFDLFKKKEIGPYMNDDQHTKNMQSQLTMSPKTLSQLRNLGVNETKELKLEYFFHSNVSEKAESLRSKLEGMNYSVQIDKSAGDKKDLCITGWTTPLQMSDDIVVNWTREMCEIGFKCDCEFDGWGTFPDQ